MGKEMNGGFDIMRVLERFFFLHNILLVILLLLSFLKRPFLKKESKNWIYTLNTVLPLLSLGYIIILVYPFWETWYGQNSYEWFSIDHRSSNNIWVFEAIFFAIARMFALLFFIRKLRLSNFMIIGYLILQNSWIWENIYWGMIKDYLPSSWSTYYEDSTSPFIQWGISIMLILLTYFILAKRKKLPNKSMFIKTATDQ